MHPEPPALLTGNGVTDDPIGETHWVIQNGIRMTGMPSFAADLSDDEIWQVALLLANAHKLPNSVQELLTKPDCVVIGSASAQSSSRTFGNGAGYPEHPRTLHRLRRRRGPAPLEMAISGSSLGLMSPIFGIAIRASAKYAEDIWATPAYHPLISLKCERAVAFP